MAFEAHVGDVCSHHAPAIPQTTRHGDMQTQRYAHKKGVGEGAQRGKERGRACAAARENVRAREADRNKVRDKDRLRNSG